MSLILRWFHDNGERHRVFYRNAGRSDSREMVIAGPDWEHAEPVPVVEPLENLPEERLVDLARSWRSRISD
jgi:hypothetical protein